jgi:EAL domain-containing protein (putative c-di-GMP-specific phosphodiesterase class I)/signal transduction histidine kinase/DNA-binding response OmpR family regulator/HPt (histidine-containing phosphotransfer) domain-containing protein
MGRIFVKEISAIHTYTHRREIRWRKFLAAKPDNPQKVPSIEQSLRDENASLRAQLSKAQDLIEFQKHRRGELSRLLKVGFWEWDEQEHLPTSYSPDVADVLGLSNAQLERYYDNPDDFKSIIHPDDLALYEENLNGRQLLTPESSCVFDYRILPDQRHVRYIREYQKGVFDDAGQLLSSFGILQDITEARLAVEALQESERRYHSLFEKLPLGVQEEDYSAVKKVVDKLHYQGVEDFEEYFLNNPRILREMVGQIRITNVNGTLLHLYEADSREIFFASEADIDDWWDAQWVEYYAAEIAALASGKKIYAAERVDSKVDGSFFETRTIVTLASGDEDIWERVITTHENISNRKKAESELVEAMKQAERANQAKSDFLSSMSHELRTPLNAILGFTQLFTYDHSLSEQHLANANEINRAGKHLLSLIDQILDLSRIESGEADLSLEPVSLERVFTDCVAWVRPLAQERRINIECDLSQFAAINVRADSIRLKQVFLNLLSNAVKYNRDGGLVEVISDEVDDQLRIGIRDSGAGISPEKLKELFQPFNRLGAEFSGIEGSGIGLVISRQLIDLMKGELEIESEVGAGSTFWVSLQLATAQAPPERGASMDPQLVSGIREEDEAVRILVAEDNLINQELMTAQLSLLGYQADYSENGIQALAHWQQRSYHLLLTDIRMPEMNGYELVQEIRRLEPGDGRRTPIIAITANALAADVDKCFMVGVDDVIAKPVELEDLRKALEKWVPAEILARSKQNSSTPVDITTPEDLSPNALPDDVIDFDVLAHSTGDKPDLHRSLLHSYEDALEQELDKIQQAFAWKNSEQIVTYSHKLKSSSRSLGVSDVARVCERLESAAKQQDWSELEQLMPLLQRSSAKAANSIQSFIQQQHDPLKILVSKDEPGLELPLDDEADVTQFSIKVLLLDDDYIMHRVTSVMLNDLGVSRVVNAMSGPDALAILKTQSDSIDVIICDLNMPDMDGVEFIRHLARSDYSGSLIVTSGEDLRILKTVEKLAIEHSLHVLGVLEKPATPAKLSELLDSLDQIQQEGTLLVYDAITLPELESAIQNGELETYFQPKIDIASGRVVGIEALARWNHPVKGLIKPYSFISLAEDNGLIGALTESICRKAMEYAASLKAMDYELKIAINLAVDSLKDLDWPEKITEVLRGFELEASSISFEITESRLMEDASIALDILSRLSLKRFNLSIDDFGTGYSSMEQLQRIPFSEFKIDRAFVHGAASDASALAILESSVLLAKKLNMTVVAEGVEDQQDWDLVASLDCDQVQGYFVSRPLPFPQLVKWLNDFKVQKQFVPGA